MRTAWRLLTRTVSDWYADRAQRTGAAVAYYTIFTLAPGLVIVMAVGGFLIGPAGEASIIAQFRDLLGERGAQAIEAMVRSARTGTPGATGLALALGTLIFGLWGVFGELQDGLNTIWRVPPRPARRIRDIVKERFWSFVVLVGTGFLLLLSLLITAWLTVVGAYVSHLLPGSALALEAVHGLLSAVVLTMAFAVIFKLLPDVELAWQDVLVGATVTALLFIVGTFLIGLYLVKWAVGSAYGAAGSLVVIVVWVYYSAQIFLLGAEFTKVWTTHVEKVVRPLTARPGEGLETRSS
ncbi:MAG TPA: YihY/virulence factor BrkB family protein [Verrucomicrobiae bacterium]|jgi:membrane protein|nr:YihY/virulence factor BrkB family protein [Verrucomicrobiae bacterium]